MPCLRQSSSAPPSWHLLLLLPGIGVGEGVSGGYGCSCQCCCLEGVHHRDVEGSVSSSCPVGDEHIRWVPSPGTRNLSSFVGPRPAETAISNSASRGWLCRAILSPPAPNDMAWSPWVALRRRHRGRAQPWCTGPSRARQEARRNSTGLRCRPRAVSVGVSSQSPEWGRVRDSRRARSLISSCPTISCSFLCWPGSILRPIIFCGTPPPPQE